METDLNTRDRSFQFGRLLAVLERTEQYYYWKTGESREDGGGRETNAIRMMAAYCQRPWHTYTILNQKLRTAYLPRLRSWQRNSYGKWTDEIVCLLSGILDGADRSQWNRPLEDTYLLGYHLQRNAMKKTTTEEKNTEEEA